MFRCLAGFVLCFLLALMGASTVAAADCQFVLGFNTLRNLIGHEIVGECLENEHYNEIGDSVQQTTGGLMAWRKADNWTALTDGYRTWINGPNGLVMRLNTERFEWEADYAPGGGVATPTPAPIPIPTPVPAAPWPGVPTVPVGVAHRFEQDGKTWEVTVLEVVRGQAVIDRVARDNSQGSLARLYEPPPPDQEDVAIKVSVKFVGSNRLGDTNAFFGYSTCGDKWCIEVLHLGALYPVMERGGNGVVEFYSSFSFGNTLDPRPFLRVGETQIGWRTWRVWKGESVVLIAKLDDDQRDLSQYSAIFRL